MTDDENGTGPIAASAGMAILCVSGAGLVEWVAGRDYPIAHQVLVAGIGFLLTLVVMRRTDAGRNVAPSGGRDHAAILQDGDGRQQEGPAPAGQ